MVLWWNHIFPKESVPKGIEFSTIFLVKQKPDFYYNSFSFSILLYEHNSLSVLTAQFPRSKEKDIRLWEMCSSLYQVH